MKNEKEFKFTREWFQDEKNKVHTIQDVRKFGGDREKAIMIGEHFLVDLYPTLDDDVEIWEVENLASNLYNKRRKQN